MSRTRIAAFAALAVMAAVPAEAHTFGAHGAGLADGIAHPFAGLDHLLAMVAVGLWAAQAGGRALWLVPAAFVAMMTLGAAAGASGIALPLVELGIVASLVAFGALVASGRKLPVAAAMAVAGAFAVFHGHAHGTEMPQAATALAYGLGFVAATATLHATGILAALSLKGPVVRVLGAAVAAAGVALMAV